MDNKKVKGKADRLRVSQYDANEFAYLKKKFPGTPHQEITGAIRAAGPMRKNVMEYLRRKQEDQVQPRIMVLAFFMSNVKRQMGNVGKQC